MSDQDRRRRSGTPWLVGAFALGAITLLVSVGVGLKGVSVGGDEFWPLFGILFLVPVWASVLILFVKGLRRDTQGMLPPLIGAVGVILAIAAYPVWTSLERARQEVAFTEWESRGGPEATVDIRDSARPDALEVKPAAAGIAPISGSQLTVATLDLGSLVIELDQKTQERLADSVRERGDLPAALSIEGERVAAVRIESTDRSEPGSSVVVSYHGADSARIYDLLLEAVE